MAANLKNVRLNAKQGDCNTPIALKPVEIEYVINLLPARANQAKRFVKHVGGNPYRTTASCNVAVAGVNLSDIAVKYNHYLARVGLELRCKLPPKLIKNRFSETTMQHLWSLYVVCGGGEK
jgi:hypothetical protein